jgi:hypothetical protein
VKQINYAHNWNGKLFMDTFSDVRLHNPDRFYVDAELEPVYKNLPMGITKVVAVKTFEFGKITDPFSYMICGKSTHYLAELLNRFYGVNGKLEPDALVDHFVQTYTKRNMAIQNGLITEWWSERT